MAQPQLPDATKIPPPPPLAPPRQPPKPAKYFAPSISSLGNPVNQHIQSNSRSKVEVTNAPFQPCHMFLYGTLTDLEVLQSVLHLPSPSTTMQPASISGFNVKMWASIPP
ncbi:hypothetical protein HBH98_055180 [Parastagonospora nodorum]|nr:hypothetical protein HBH49_057560 [Parastagonospora nodorum]KAH4071734.1 hypothetical protein HBH50_067910 [Parastagonospora nodorum]KAH4094618.1 hypothetical protein HBH48_056180 [Parastagonospora nodorum]KAH4202267.1 hypothetical protein HBH42_016030 [Parastagonospora nodorum]KAH4230255.1 hypothetical protein HBI06_081200 [Parastagonospora nodorum]